MNQMVEINLIINFGVPSGKVRWVSKNKIIQWNDIMLIFKLVVFKVIVTLRQLNIFKNLQRNEKTKVKRNIEPRNSWKYFICIKILTNCSKLWYLISIILFKILPQINQTKYCILKSIYFEICFHLTNITLKYDIRTALNFTAVKIVNVFASLNEILIRKSCSTQLIFYCK